MTEFFRQGIILPIIGAILGVLGTLVVQQINTINLKKELHRKVHEEIMYNSRLGQTMELTGSFKEFEVSAWDNLRGTPAFYEIPAETRKPLDTHYSTLKWYNNGLLKWKKLEQKEAQEMTMKNLVDLTYDYFKFLVLKGILKPGEIIPKDDLKELEKKYFPAAK